ncbi:MAG: hypothetical protein EXQ91_08655 [Alphaproteobacteria bacterium]|nr:hypothetical protein [Alphaproteobacteria bacterium]
MFESCKQTVVYDLISGPAQRVGTVLSYHATEEFAAMMRRSTNLEATPANPTADTAPRPDVARYRYSVRTEAQASILAKVIEMFAIRSLVPQRLTNRLGDVSPAELRIEIEVVGLDPMAAQHLKARIEQFPDVRSVRLLGL